MRNSNKNTISVLIPTWKRVEKLTLCLEHISQQTRIADEVIVVIRTEDIASLEVIKKFKQVIPSLKEVYTDKIGVIAAENAGLKVITNDLVAFIDDDAYAPADWLKKIDDFFSTHSDASALGGSDIIVSEPWTYTDFPAEVVGKITWYGKIIGNHHRKALGTLRIVDVLKGVNMTFKRKMIDTLDENLAGADGHLGNGSQWELDLCMNVRNKEGVIYFSPDLIVNHDSNHSHHEYVTVAKNNTHNLCYVMLKNLSFFKKIIFIFYSLIIGNVQLPGLIKNMSDIIMRPKKFTFQLIISKYVGFFSAINTYWRLH